MTARLQDASRREFLKTGAGLVVGIALAPELALGQGAAAPARLPGSLNNNRLLSSWLRINPNGNEASRATNATAPPAVAARSQPACLGRSPQGKRSRATSP